MFVSKKLMRKRRNGDEEGLNSKRIYLPIGPPGTLFSCVGIFGGGGQR